MTEYEIPLRLIYSLEGDWFFTDRVAEWLVENMHYMPILDVKQSSKWYPKHRCHLSSIDAKVRFTDPDDALFFKVVWL
jgi:hypothetical protein